MLWHALEERAPCELEKRDLSLVKSATAMIERIDKIRNPLIIRTRSWWSKVGLMFALLSMFLTIADRIFESNREWIWPMGLVVSCGAILNWMWVTYFPTIARSRWYLTNTGNSKLAEAQFLDSFKAFYPSN